MDWTQALEVPADQLKASITSVRENQEYVFRVKAVNKAGPGQPSDSSTTVVCKARFGK